eukprot:TRINITY_DN9422_c0_g1_i5.p1 TRINITY_DN9422_c0_g1~~TRINITY_DN9422_c0_g1_i5.p1  ORF type:complete len:267 (-),score=27.93 TRINITY_DN9422_c0_g1_i5:359-1159(-)
MAYRYDFENWSFPSMEEHRPFHGLKQRQPERRNDASPKWSWRLDVADEDRPWQNKQWRAVDQLKQPAADERPTLPGGWNQGGYSYGQCFPQAQGAGDAAAGGYSGPFTGPSPYLTLYGQNKLRPCGICFSDNCQLVTFSCSTHYYCTGCARQWLLALMQAGSPGKCPECSSGASIELVCSLLNQQEQQSYKLIGMRAENCVHNCFQCHEALSFPKQDPRNPQGAVCPYCSANLCAGASPTFPGVEDVRGAEWIQAVSRLQPGAREG